MRLQRSWRALWETEAILILTEGLGRLQGKVTAPPGVREWNLWSEHSGCIVAAVWGQQCSVLSAPDLPSSGGLWSVSLQVRHWPVKAALFGQSNQEKQYGQLQPVEVRGPVVSSQALCHGGVVAAGQLGPEKTSRPGTSKHQKDSFQAPPQGPALETQGSGWR